MPPGSTKLGQFTLLPHQIEAVHRLRPLLATHGGALLADAVGLGKTIVALALARDYGSVSVIAPAVLVPMWRETAKRAGVQVNVYSLHRFSGVSGAAAGPRKTSASGTRLVIIDEAHHLRNPHTQRYAGVADVCRGAPVLLLSATPVHNKASDLAHMLALFLGRGALSLPLEQLQVCVVRRDEQTATQKPDVIAHPSFHIGDNAEVTRALTNLPPPVPTRDGVAAGALITLGLIRAWCSSAAACLAAVQRRRSRALALDSILSEGRWPSQQELRAWTVTEDTVQLGFTALLVADTSRHAHYGSLAEAQAQLQRHRSALEALEQLVRDTVSSLDRARGEALRRVRRAHAGITIIAFTQYADTVRAIGQVLRWDAGVATLTSRGGRIASGPLSRRELLQRVAPRAHGVSAPPAHERVYLLLTTDLLAEGVNLQDAGVVVHLDWPWTPAAIAQREGRIARLGSAFLTVHAYAIAPPGGGTAVLRLAERLRRKARSASVVLASDATPLATRRLMALPSASSPMERTLQRWTTICVPNPSPDATVPGAGEDPSAMPTTTVIVLRHARAGWLAALPSSLVGGWFAGKRTRVSRVRRTLSVLVQTVEREAAREKHIRVHFHVDLPANGQSSAPSRAPSSSDVDRWVETHLCAICRALQREALLTHRDALVNTLQSPIHRAQRIIRGLLAGATLPERLRLRLLAAAASRSVRALRGAGDERALEALLRNAPAHGQAEPWLRAVAELQQDSAGGRLLVVPESIAVPSSWPKVIVLLLPPGIGS